MDPAAPLPEGEHPSAPHQPAPYQPAPYQPAEYPSAPHQPVQYQPAPYPSAPYASAPYQPAPYPSAYLQPGQGYAPPPKKVYALDRADAIWALGAAGLGLAFWNWLWPQSDELVTTTPTGGTVAYVSYLPAAGVTALAVLALACSLGYFLRRGLRLTRPSGIGLVLLLLAALPHALYAGTPIHIFSGLALVAGYGLWHAYAAGTAVAPGLGALTPVDLVNQGLVVPFANAGAWFAGLRHLGRGLAARPPARAPDAATPDAASPDATSPDAATPAPTPPRPARLGAAVLGLVIALPVFAIVMALLVTADARFGEWMGGIGRALGSVHLGTLLWQLLLGIPVAIGVFSSWYGNAHRRGTGHLTAAGAGHAAQAARGINPAALAAPVAVLCFIYVVFFAAMSTYLFSAFAGKLPADFTYAVYARQGFFQLVAVATINLAVAWFASFFARRAEPHYPPVLRLLGAVLTALTCVMVAVAMSKMLLYLGQFDLTRLRVYTLWFMGVLLVVCALVLAWHIRPFRVATPIAWVGLVSFLALSWANTDAIIANYNVGHYLDGTSATVDIDYLAHSLSDAAIPALIELRGRAPGLADAVTTALADRTAVARGLDAPWQSWNWQTAQADRLLTQR